jgi:hypothetical protein
MIGLIALRFAYRHLPRNRCFMNCFPYRSPREGLEPSSPLANQSRTGPYVMRHLLRGFSRLHFACDYGSLPAVAADTSALSQHLCLHPSPSFALGPTTALASATADRTMNQRRGQRQGKATDRRQPDGLLSWLFDFQGQHSPHKTRNNAGENNQRGHDADSLNSRELSSSTHARRRCSAIASIVSRTIVSASSML